MGVMPLNFWMEEVKSKGTREKEEFKTNDLQNGKEELEENSSSPTLKLGSLF
jgi:hypothetical protein